MAILIQHLVGERPGPAAPCAGFYRARASLVVLLVPATIERLFGYSTVTVLLVVPEVSAGRWQGG